MLSELTGRDVDCFSVFGDSVDTLADLVAEAESSVDKRWLMSFHVNKMILAFWRGDYIKAAKHFNAASTNPTAQLPQISTFYHTLYGGLVFFQLHKQQVGTNTSSDSLQQGKQCMDRMQQWSTNCPAVFENKWYMLGGEYLASIGESHKAQLAFKASITAAQDHGNIHEMGLASELLGNCLSANGCIAEGVNCYKQAYTCYMQWGANALADRLKNKHDLSVDLLGAGLGTSSKRTR